MPLFTATFVKNKCILLAISLQRQLSPAMSFNCFQAGAGLRPRKCGAGASGDVLRGGAGAG